MLKADKNALAAALAAVAPAIKAKNTIPVLQNILIAKEGGKMVARGGNLDIEMTCTFEAAAGPDFVPFTCPVQMITEFVKRAPDITITVEPVVHADELTYVNLKSGRSRLKVPVLPASSYPKLDAGKLSCRIEMDAEIFANAVASVSYAVSTDETRVYISGVFLKGADYGVDVVSTDGHRMERRLITAITFDPAAPFAQVPPVIIPPESINRMLKLAADVEDVILEFAEEKIQITAGAVTLISKLIDGEFPDWDRISKIARENEATVRFSKAAMTDAIERVLLATPDARKGMSFSFADGNVTLRANDMANGEGEDTIDADADFELTLGFNGKYVREALAHHIGDDVELRLRGSMDPAVLHAPGKTEDFALLLPTRITGMVTS